MDTGTLILLADDATTAAANSSAAFWTMLAAFLGLVVLIIGKASDIWSQYKAAKKVDAVAAQAVVVQKTLAVNTANTDSKLNGLAAVAGATHALVNSRFGDLLKQAADFAQRLADSTKRAGDPSAASDQKAADTALALYKEHQAKQALLDSANTGTLIAPIPTPPKISETGP